MCGYGCVHVIDFYSVLTRHLYCLTENVAGCEYVKLMEKKSALISRSLLFKHLLATLN